MKISKRILSVILALAVLIVSLPMTLVASAEVPAISTTEYPVGDVLWSFDASNVTAAPDWAHGCVKNGWGTGATSIALADTGAVRLTAGAVDGMFYLPEIKGDPNNFIYEISYNVSGAASSAGLAINATESAGATWVATYHQGKDSGATSGNKYGYYRRKGTVTIGQTFYQNQYTQPVAGSTTPETLKVVVLNGYTYAYVNDQLMTLADGVEGFADPNTTANINLALFVTNTAIDVYSITVTAIAEPEETLIWDGTFDAANLPTADADGDGEIEITTPEQFAAVASSTGLDADGNRIKYELTKDIYLNDTTVEGWKDNSPNQWIAPVTDISTATVFNGIINGNGRVIRGMYLDATLENDPDQKTAAEADADYDASQVLAEGSATEYAMRDTVYAGLFPVIGQDAGLIGIGVEDAYVSVKDSREAITLTDGSTKAMNLVGSVGALVGAIKAEGSNYAIIDQCYADASVELIAGRAGFIGSGIVGGKAVVSNCYSECTATVFKGTSLKSPEWDNDSGNRFMLVAGGGNLTGKITIYSCYTLGNVANNGAFDKNIAAGSSYINVYYFSGWSGSAYATDVDGNNIKGEGAKNYMPNLDWDKFEVVSGARPVLSIFSTHTQASGASVWNGTTTDSSATDSDGDGYVEIKTANQLAYAIANSVSAELMNDIWLNDITVYAKGSFYLNNMNKAAKEWLHNAYNASFNGNGYVVHGVFYDTEPTLVPTTTTTPKHSESYSGLIPATGAGSIIEKVGVEDSFLRNNSNYNLGAVVGHFGASGVSIDRTYAGESVYIHGVNGVGGITGGGSGSNQTKSITNSYSLATLKYTSKYGGIVGDMWTPGVYTVKYCYTTSGALIGQSASLAEAVGNYNTGSKDEGSDAGVSAGNMMGEAALTNMAALNTENAYVTTMGYPTLKIFDPNYVEEEEVGEVWNGSIAMSYAGGSGTEADPYIISKGSQLARAVNLFGEDGAYYKLDRDIYLNDVTKTNWKDSALGWFESATEADYAAYRNIVSDDRKTGATGTFNGNIDGNGFHIYGVYYSADSGSTSSALFPVMSGGSVKNLGLDHFYVAPGTGAAAGIAAFTVSLADAIEVEKCYIGEDCTFTGGGGKAAAGFFGYIKGTTKTNYISISNSYALFPQSALSAQEFKQNAFIGETWNSYYKLNNVFSVARPVNPTTEAARASQFCEEGNVITSAIADTLKNVYTTTDVDGATQSMEYYDDGAGNIIRAYTNLDPSLMKGASALDNMNINGDGAFLYNIGYPSLTVFGNTVPSEEELLAGLVNIATAMPMTEYKVDTKDFIISGTIVNGNAVSIALDDANKTTLSIAADGTVTLVSGDDTITKVLTLGDTAEYKLAAVGDFLIAFVDGECVGLVGFEAASGYTATFTGFDLENENTAIMVDLYVQDVAFDSVEFTDVNVQLADRLGNSNSGGVKLDITLRDESYIDDMGYDVEYGYLVYVGDKLVDGITVDDAKAFQFNASTEYFEVIGLDADKQELFFALRGYAKIIVNENVEHYYYGATETIFSPIYEANDLYGNEAYAEAIKAIYGGSDKFIENLTQDIEFALFADYHYKEGMYTSQLSDLKAIVETADTLNDGQGADFVFSLGDMSNNMKGSKEITNYLLNGTWTDANGTAENTHNYAFYNIYGNHELEDANYMSYVNTVLTNSEVHWGDGSVGSSPAVNANASATRNELATGTYYWFEVNGIRVVIVNTNFSWNPNHVDGVVVGWEHNLPGSYGCPTAAKNAERGFDEGTAAKANIKTNHLGDLQLAWLEATLMDAVEQGTPCIVMGHDSFATDFGGSSAKAEVRALYAKANAIRSGTVIASFNGHLHTNRQQVLEDVLYLDINTVRNSWWQGGTSGEHYTAAQTFTYDYYDDDGNYSYSETKSLTTLSQSTNTWFANDPVHCTVRVTQAGVVELSGMDSSWMYDVVPESAPDYAQPGITSGAWTVGDATFTAAE